MPKGSVQSRNGAAGGILRKLGTVYWDKTNLTYKIKAPKEVGSNSNEFLQRARDNLTKLPLFRTEANKEDTRKGMTDDDLFRYFGATSGKIKGAMKQANKKEAHRRVDKLTGLSILSTLKNSSRKIQPKFLTDDYGIKQLNPDFNSAENQRKIAIMQDKRKAVMEMKKHRPAEYADYKEEQRKKKRKYAHDRKLLIKQAQDSGRIKKKVSQRRGPNLYKSFSAGATEDFDRQFSTKTAFDREQEEFRRKRGKEEIPTSNKRQNTGITSMESSYHSTSPRSSYNHYAMDDSD